MHAASLAWSVVPLALFAGSVGACSAAARDLPSQAGDGGGASTDETTADGGVSALDLIDGSAPSQEKATLHGSVRAPNVSIPISGALVYMTDQPPEPLVHGVHCDACVTLTQDVPYALSEADGTFELPAYAGEHYLVVQKGGFRRVRKISVTAGDQDVPRPQTSLPAMRDPSKDDEVPTMAVMQATFDQIGDSLKELGLSGAAFTTVSDVESFLKDYDRMKEFEIVFLPCGTDYDLAADPVITDNLRKFAEGGGRVYATDWHYDFVHRSWPGYISWEGQSTVPCSGCSSSEYDADAQVEDQGLKDWLAAQNITNFKLERNYTTILNVNARPGKDKDGNDVTITPKVWVNGRQPSQPTHPTTVSFEQGCGRVLFSTYHTESSTTVMPQERALLYVLLEVSVCTESSEGVIVR
jgi:hypothetical protein